MKTTNWVLSVALAWASLIHWASGDAVRYLVIPINIFLLYLLWFEDACARSR